jgi:hypothetical protein
VADDKASWKASLVPIPDDAVDAADAEIWWSLSDDSKVVGVVVTSRKERLRGGERQRPGTQDMGASSSDWLQPDAPVGMSTPAMLTPEGAFGVLISQGFANAHELKNALVQFARIRGCDWARAMLFAFTDKDVNAIREEAERRRRAAPS